MSTLTVKELAAPTGYDLKIASGETLDLKSQGTVTLPTGSILQVVTATTGTNTQVTSTSYTDTTLTASITPSSASNKVLILVSQQCQGERSTNSEFGVYVQLLRDATSVNIIEPLSLGAGTDAGGKLGMRTIGAMAHLDSPSTTSAITYKTQGKITTTANSATCRFQEGGTESSIVLVEVQG